MRTKLFYTLLLAILLPSTVLAQKKEVTFMVASDLHFDMPPETDQYVHVLAMNKLGAQQKRIDAVILTGDLCDKEDPAILHLFRQRYEMGTDKRTIHYPVFPMLGNHDVAPEKGRPETESAQGKRNINIAYMDSILRAKLAKKEILNLHPSSLSYSYNLGHVHFVCSQVSAGETSYCESNFDWLENDLNTYAAHGEPVVFLQHYGVDEFALKWWTEESWTRLFSLLKGYNLAGFFVGHAHSATLQYFKGTPVFQVNNAWGDTDGKASFALVNIKGNKVTIKNYRVEDKEGNITMEQPILLMEAPINR